MRQGAIGPDALIEVQGSDAPVRHESQADAVKVALHGLIARHRERGQLATILGRALHAIAPAAVYIVRHLARLRLAWILLIAPHEPARQRLQLLWHLD